MFKAFTPALFKKNKGFTLVELMVVSGIIIFMTAVVLINYRPGGQQLALSRSAHKLAQDIRRAQEMAMSSREEGVCGPGFSGGYGIRLSRLGAVYPGPERYILFADCNNNKEYEAGIDRAIEDVRFEPGIRFNKIQYRDGGVWNPADPGVGESSIDIIFSPPDPERSIFTADIALNNAPEQRLRLMFDSGQFKYIYVNNAGLIYVE